MKGYVVQPAETKRHEEYTCTFHQKSNLDLVYSAGKALFQAFTKWLNPQKDPLILIVAGRGNNGCDGIYMGKLLVDAGFNVKIVMMKESIPSDENSQAILNTINSDYWSYLDEIKDLHRVIDRASYLIDAIFGTGLNRNVEGYVAKIIQEINHASAFVCSIDIPSGIDCFSGKVKGISIQANLTWVLDYYKFGNLLVDGPDCSGEIKLVDTGILMDPSLPKRMYLGLEDLALRYPERKKHSHKYDYGNVLVIGGHAGMLGAPQLSAIASLRSGAGLATVCMKISEIATTQLIFPEVMFAGYESIEHIDDILAKKDVIVFGPGLGRNHPINEEIIAKILQSNLPLVIDADGLYYLKKHLHSLPNDCKIIITPHLGELAKLLDLSPESLTDNLEQSIRHLTDLGLVVIVKGYTTVCADSDHFVFASEGNPGMATAGSGDVLSGIIAGLIGRKRGLYDSATQGVLLHQFAGKLARDEKGEESMVASDIVQKIPDAILSTKASILEI